MKLSSLIEQERISSHYNRKKILQRKQAGDAYRKNSLYFQPKKNPLLLELENLLLGHTDQDLYEQQKEESKEVTPQQQAIIEDLQQTKKSVLAHEKTQKAEALEYSQLEHIDGEASIVDVETLQILEQLKDTAQPSPQDLRVAASANAQIQNGQELDESELDDSQPAFVREVIEVKVPERFSKELKLDPFADTIFGKSYAEAYKARTFKYASEKYTTHIQMAKDGYLPGNDSMFSMIA
ncbi:hypothetical protein [Lysinibacillus xylanilyticus]|uniref:hypothetical protein n=1 Tax=Lysinibacillus xylanilyticus TaxID=582475 RepID=UPI003D061370